MSAKEYTCTAIILSPFEVAIIAIASALIGAFFTLMYLVLN